jgi:anti-sigma factor RsiW
MTDAELKQLLAEQLPRHAAPPGLVQRLNAPPAARRRGLRWLPSLASALLAALLMLVALRLTRPTWLQRETLFDEAVNDHLRVVASQHPVEIESGGIHQVKPWFTGRLDFAPPVSFSGDAEFTLVGGSVGYFRDRRAAVFVFTRRLHTISLFVFRSDGLALPDRATRDARGFHVRLWRDGDLGWALVSDVNRDDLESLAQKLR